MFPWAKSSKTVLAISHEYYENCVLGTVHLMDSYPWVPLGGFAAAPLRVQLIAAILLNVRGPTRPFQRRCRSDPPLCSVTDSIFWHSVNLHQLHRASRKSDTVELFKIKHHMSTPCLHGTWSPASFQSPFNSNSLKHNDIYMRNASLEIGPGRNACNPPP